MEFNNIENKPYNTEDGIIYHSRSVAICGTIITYYNGEPYVLIGKRSKKMDNSGKLNLPCGYLDWNETIEEGFYREIYEETKLNIKEVLKNNLVKYYKNEPWSVRTNINTEKQNITLHMALIFESDELPKLEHDFESDWVKWIRVNDFIDVGNKHIAFNHKSVLIRFMNR